MQRDSEMKFNLKLGNMVRIEKYKFKNRFESLETKNLSVAINNLQGYRCVGGNLWLSTKFVGEYAKVYFLDVNGEPVEL